MSALDEIYFESHNGDHHGLHHRQLLNYEHTQSYSQ